MNSSVDSVQEAIRHHAFKSAGKHEPRCRILLAFLTTSQKLRDFLRHSLLQQKLTEVGFRILTVLFNHGEAPLSHSQIASLASLWPPTVSDVLSRLEVSGLIARSRSHIDRCQVFITLTPAGRKQYTSAVTALVNDMVQLAGPVAPSDFSALRSACDALDSRVAEMKEEERLRNAPTLDHLLYPRMEARTGA